MSKSPAVTALLSLVAALGIPASAHAEEEPPPAKVRFGELEVRGRAILRAELPFGAGRTLTSDLAIDSARAEVRYTWKEWLRVVVEMELAGKAELKDGYIRAKKGMWGARIGHFKPPVSAIELESPWVLPVADRGLVTEVLRKHMGIGGRSPGLQAELKVKKALGLKIRAGVFQASDAVGDLFKGNEIGAQKLAGRVSVSPWKLELGLFAEWRPAEPVLGASLERFWTAGADASLNLKFERHAFRMWADAFVGSTWQDDDPFDGSHDVFMAGRTIAAWRYGGMDEGALYGEVYAMFGAVDPEARIVDDAMYEAAGGVNAGAWKHLRITLEVRYRHLSRNVPASLGMLDPATTLPTDGTTIILEAGGAF